MTASRKIREYVIERGPLKGTYGSVSIGCHKTVGTRRAITGVWRPYRGSVHAPEDSIFVRQRLINVQKGNK
jgi:hypothetical protein